MPSLDQNEYKGIDELRGISAQFEGLGGVGVRLQKDLDKFWIYARNQTVAQTVSEQRLPASWLASSTVQGARKKKFLGVVLIAVRPVFRLRHG